ncbi:superoxide dismutase [Legionella israelensis]|uniref:Superoxide dismutase [Cu-Zn] n=2 Tax=Legionella israelensis TaxID=454 RepID=A0A0W0V2I1_9GAMM|nr:superoxide dismutase [Cu-Zn] precursor [Legionella israelensis]SCX94307.1 superoxide dismutase, Cu-Zn family [Legionella israelensis DSM 19235]QBR84653.1 superoxide dismutase [Legionella israelensis]QBS10541.1 superoxide dismutase [Legionella israelensis]QDP72225.1 superoxide dismutase family protein [Legionella israelensis]
MKKYLIFLSTLIFSFNIYAAEISVKIYKTGNDKPIGDIQFKDTKYGLLVTPDLSQLPPGLHGLHLHQNPSCADKGQAAGGHFDPKKTNTHQGPYGKGHLGDLPVLYVNKEDKADVPTLAPRLKVKDLKGLTVMIHAGGDNYSDTPKLGGGGDRIACGVVKMSDNKKS